MLPRLIPWLLPELTLGGGVSQEEMIRPGGSSLGNEFTFFTKDCVSFSWE